MNSTVLLFKNLFGNPLLIVCFPATVPFLDAETDEKTDRTSGEMEPEISREKEEPQVMRLKIEGILF